MLLRKLIQRHLLTLSMSSAGRKPVSQMDTSANFKTIKDVYDTAQRSVEPRHMVANNLQLVDGHLLRVGRGDDSRVLDLQGKRCHVVAFGKAVIGMVAAVESLLGDQIISGIASIPTDMQRELSANGRRDLLPSPESKVRLCEGAHLNTPDAACLKTSEEIMQLVSELTESDILITLTSGGGSALLCLPVPPLTLQDVARCTKALSKAGADITQLNTVRKHLELLKGGGLARLAQPAQVVNLILSDIVGDPIDCIASGPTVHDTSTPEEALDIIERFIPDEQCVGVRDVLKVDGKQASLSQLCDGVSPWGAHNIIIGSNRIALQSGVSKCHNLSLLPVIVTSQLCGEAAQVGRDMAQLASSIITDSETSNLLEGLFAETKVFEGDISETLGEAVVRHRKDKVPLCLLFGGETTVKVTGNGKGGRNQEMCLSAMIAMQELRLPANRVTFTSVGTDGQDGPTDAAGACISPQCMMGSELFPQTYLANNDSYSYFSKINGGRNLVQTGLTGTNVMDVNILLIHP